MSVSRQSCWILVTLLAVLGATNSSARILNVSSDGTTPYTTIYSAADAAAAGDTILIQPGNYTQAKTYSLPAGDTEIYGYLRVPDVTIIGAVQDDVVIGHLTEPAGDTFGPVGFISADGSLTIEGVTLVNFSFGIYFAGTEGTARRVKTIGCYNGIKSLVSVGLYVGDCNILNGTRFGLCINQLGGGTMALVERTNFEDNIIGIDSQLDNTVIQECDFKGGIVGAQISFGGSGSFRACNFTDYLNVGIGSINRATLSVQDCTFGFTQGSNIIVNGGGFSGSGNVLMGGAFASIQFGDATDLQFAGNHILNGGGVSIFCHQGVAPLRHLDFSNNYWGTADSAQISAWIDDANDTQDPHYYIVDFEPFAGSAIATEGTSFGSLKARSLGGRN